VAKGPPLSPASQARLNESRRMQEERTRATSAILRKSSAPSLSVRDIEPPTPFTLRCGQAAGWRTQTGCAACPALQPLRCLYGAELFV
jgi:hypothetical protein